MIWNSIDVGLLMHIAYTIIIFILPIVHVDNGFDMSIKHSFHIANTFIVFVVCFAYHIVVDP